MGGCSSKGATLHVLAANGDVAAAQELLKKHPKAALFINFKDRSSPLIQAAARGHFELLQTVLETAVMVEGPEKAKRLCVDHRNAKKQTALMVACKHGHADCVEYLVTNGADPLVADARRHNTCLHFAALYGHTECVHKLLGSRATFQQQGRSLTVSQLLCHDGDSTITRFVDRHNGWGLSALHIAVFQGSVNTVRALLRHGASLDSVITAAEIENSPIRCAVGSNALHIAALIGNISMAKVILEAQDSVPGLELRSRTDAAGLRPGEYAQRARNPVLVHLLDERLPVSLLRQIWINYSLEQSMPPRHQTLGAMLQKLKLMFNLEIIAVQRNLAASAQEASDILARAACAGGIVSLHASSLSRTGSNGRRQPALEGPMLSADQYQHLQQRALWTKRQEEVQALLNSVTQLHATLQGLCRRGEDGNSAEWPGGSTSSQEAVLDFILSTLITPRTVSSIVYAAKKLVCSNVMAVVAANPANSSTPTLPAEVDVQHGIALLSTALRAVETCLQAASHLSNPATLAAAAEAGAVAAAAADGSQPQSSTAGAMTDAAPAPAVTLADGSAAALPQPQPQSPPLQSQPQGAGAHNVSLSTSALATSIVLGRPLAASALAPVTDGEPSSPPLATQDGSDAPLQLGTSAQPLGVGGLQSALAGLPGGATSPFLSSHWSAHLHSVIAQLHWDIGVQRHRRRRQHAAQQAARAAAAAAASGMVLGDPNAAPDPTLLPGRTTIPAPASTLASMPARQRRRQSSRSTARSVGSVPGQTASEGQVPMSFAPNIPSPTIQSASATAPSAVAAAASGPAAVQASTCRPAADASEGMLLRSLSIRSAEGTQPADGVASTPTGTRSVSMGRQPLDAASNNGEIIPQFAELSGHGTASLVSQPASATSLGTACASRGGPCGMGGGGGDKRSVDHGTPLGELSEDNLSGGEEEAGSMWSDDDSMLCSICMDQPVAVQVTGCQHGLCVQCAFQLTVKGRELPSCPFCRQKIPAFEAKSAEASAGPAGLLPLPAEHNSPRAV